MISTALALVLCFAAPGEAAAGPGEAEGEAAANEDDPRSKSPAYANRLDPLPEAQRDEDAAKAMMASAKTAFRDERYEEAIEFLAEAYRTYPYVTLLYSLGSAHRRAYEIGGDPIHLRLSIRRYQQYLSEAPDAEYADLAQNYLTAMLAERDLGEVSAEAVTRILISTAAEDATMSIDGGDPLPAPGVVSVEPGRHRVDVSAPGYHDFTREVEVPEGANFQIQAELEDRPGDIVVEGPKGATVRVDGKVVGKLPLNRSVSVEPGTHVVQVTKNGHETYSRDVEIEREGWELMRVDLSLSNRRVASYFLMGVGGAGLVATSVLAGFAIERTQRAAVFADRLANDQLTTEEYATYRELADQRDAYRGAAVLTGAVGGSLLLTGVILFARDRPRVGVGGAQAQLLPSFGPGQVGMVGTLAF